MTTYYDRDLAGSPLDFMPAEVQQALVTLAQWQAKTGVTIKIENSVPSKHLDRRGEDKPIMPFIWLGNIPRRWVNKLVTREAKTNRVGRRDSDPYPKIFGDFTLAGVECKVYFAGDAEHQMRQRVAMEARLSGEKDAAWLASKLIQYKHPLGELDIVGSPES